MTVNYDSKHLYKTLGSTEYLTWWAIADLFPSLIRCCVLVKIVCKASRLKSDEFRLKGFPYSSRACELYDNFTIENIEHIVMQCPNVEGIRRNVYSDFENLNPIFLQKIKERPSGTLFWMLGDCTDGQSFDF